MIFHNLLCNGEAQSTPLCLSIAHERLEYRIPDCQGNAGAVVPNVDVQARSIAGSSHNDPPLIRGDGLACIQNEVGNHSLEAIGIEPAHGRAFMLMSDCNPPKLLSHAGHPDRAFDDVKDASSSRLKSIPIP